MKIAHVDLSLLHSFLPHLQVLEDTHNQQNHQQEDHEDDGENDTGRHATLW